MENLNCPKETTAESCAFYKTLRRKSKSIGTIHEFEESTGRGSGKFSSRAKLFNRAECKKFQGYGGANQPW